MKNIATLCFPIKEEIIFLALKKRGFGAGLLNGYGGKPKEGEDIIPAVCRELIEEGKIEISQEDLDLMAVIDFYEESKLVFECHVFFLTNWKGTLQETEEMGPPEEFRLDDLPFNRMWKGDKVWLTILCSGQKIRAKVIYQNGMKEIASFEYHSL